MEEHQEKHLKNNEILLGKIAGYLARYHFHKIRVRSTHIASGFPLPREIEELENYQFWALNSWSSNFKLSHGQALNNVIQHNTKEILTLVDDAKTAPETSKEILNKVQGLKEQLDKAHELLVKLNG